ncbi:PAS domain S-box protein [Kitasatospora sp. NPDC093679]|uniref:PAS domain S-box protein n=1 Tax=Kitasatospora sp. NPDC093679 TaxID=3154983 RepID=UPI0034391734
MKNVVTVGRSAPRSATETSGAPVASRALGVSRWEGAGCGTSGARVLEVLVDMADDNRSLFQGHQMLDADDERFRLLAKNSPDMVFRRTLEGVFLEVSAPALELLGRPADEVVGTFVGDWVDAEDQEDLQAAERDLVGWGRATVALRVRRGDGTLRWVESTLWVVRGEAGQPLEVRGFFRESGERGRGELLRALQERARSVIDSANDGFVSIDEQGLVIDWNPSAQKLFGFTREEALGRPLTETIIPERYRTAHIQGLQRVLASGEPHILGRQIEITALHRDGHEIPVELAVWPMRLGATRCFNAFVRDITERRRVQQALSDARDQAMEATRVKSQFLATMSHEIRTPMNGVIGLSELLLNTDLDAVQLRYAEGIHDAGRALLTLINDILDFSKLEAGKLVLEEVVFDPHPLVDEVVTLVAQTAPAQGLELLADCHPDLPIALRADASRLRQILLNLASNAVKFTHEGEVVIRARPQAADAYFEVVDTGIGIDPADQERMFDVFAQADASTTRHYGGTGLGLAICRRLIDAMGGTMGVKSEPGHGSTFWFTIPLHEPATGEQPPPAPRPSSLRGLHVLIVDDNATNRFILHEQMHSWSMRPATVDGGPQALVELHRAAAAGTPYELAVIDHHMPGMSGIELAGHITSDPDLASVRLLLLTSGTAAPTAELRAAGIRDSLSKPVRQSELHDCLARLMAPEPTAQAALPPVRAPARARASAPRRAHVLLVEDNEINQTVALGMLEQLGYSADVADDGIEALEMAATGRYRAVLMDCRMPHMDGYAATMELRRREGSGPRLPVIAMTASILPEDRERCLAAGMDDYVSKPIAVTALREALARWAGNEPPRADPDATSDPAAGVPGLRQGIEQRLDEISGDNAPGSQQLITRLTNSFLRKAPLLADALLTAVDHDNPADTVDQAHALKGAASNIGAHDLARCAAELEDLARTDQLSQADPLADRLPDLLRETCSALESIRARSSG